MELVKLALRDFTADLPAHPDRDLSHYATLSTTTPRSTLRRCRTREQGVALITVGHAIEYLMQSRLIQQPTTTGAEREAFAILLNANLSVYNDGAEIVPLISRLRRWFHGGSRMKAAAAR